MTKFSLGICLVLLVALSTIYETQGTFSLPIYLKNFPKLGKDFESFAYKGILDYLGELEGKCPATKEFNNFFEKLKDYMACFESNSPVSKDIQSELTIRSEKLFTAMSALDGGKSGISEDSWRLVDGLLSLGKGFLEMKKIGSNEITFEQRKEVINFMVRWTRAIGLFVKTASKTKGKPIDLTTFGVDYETSVERTPHSSKRTLYETKGTFSLPHYLKNFPKMGKDFEPFAYKGMMDFSDSLESKCPATEEFKDFFIKVEDFMACFKSASPGSEDSIKGEMSIKSEKLFKAMSLLDGGKSGTSVDSWRMVDGMLSMGKLVVEMKKYNSNEISFEQRKELVSTMVKWARAIGLFAKTASENKGKPFDLSVFGIDYTHVASPFDKPSGEL